MTVESILKDNLKLCVCGCGQEVKNRFVQGHNSKMAGETHWKWKGGKKISKGYNLIWKPDHPYCDSQGYVKEHRLVMEQHLGRYLIKKEEVHHIDGNRINNQIKNLMLFENHSEHVKYECDKSGIICLLCKSTNTYIKKIREYEYPDWYKYQNNWICKKCYMKEYRKQYKVTI